MCVFRVVLAIIILFPKNIRILGDLAFQVGGRLKYPHRSPASRKRRRKGNPVPGGYSWATLFAWDINTGTGSLR
jgi:hypothetical protein